MKGIILAGGSGTRLYPVTNCVCKQLLPVYDKPMIYYPLSVLMLAGIRDILIITTPEDNDKFKQLFNDGSHLGINISYAIQSKPRGLADAFLVGEKFIGDSRVCLVLGDNIFYGSGLQDVLEGASRFDDGATIFGYYVNDPERYGVVNFDEKRRITSIEEKPQSPQSNYAVVGLYFYDNRVVDIAKNLEPSDRGEIEITDVNKAYLENGKLNVKLFGRGFAWLDTGTHDSLADATMFIKAIEDRQGLKIACLEEIAFRKAFIDKSGFVSLIEKMSNNDYRKYLEKILNEDL